MQISSTSFCPAFRESLARDLQGPDRAWVGLGLAYYEMKRFPEAIAAFLARTPGARELDLATDAGIRQPHGRQLLAQDGGHDGFYYAKLIKIAASRG